MTASCASRARSPISTGRETIGLAHLAEAIQYRTYDFSVAEP